MSETAAPVTQPAPDLVSADAARQAARAYAPALQLSLDDVDIRLDPAAIRLLDDRGVRGAALGNVVWLRRFDPRSSASRLTLAHELVHVAQARLPQSPQPSRWAAEAEADRLAHALISGAAVGHPREPLAPAMHFDGETPRAPSLEDLVRRNYGGEMRTLAQLLRDREPSSGNISQALYLLAPLEFETARILVGLLSGPEQAAFANGLNAGHGRAQRREALAAASNFNSAALALRRNGWRLFSEMRIDTASLTAAEHRAAVAILRRMPVDDLMALEGGDNGPAFRALRTGVLPEYDRDEVLARLARLEARRRGTGVNLSSAEDELYTRLSNALSRIDRTRAQSALTMLSDVPLLDLPDPRFSGARPEGDTAPAAAASAEARVPAATLQNVIDRLESDGRVAPWIDALEPADRSGSNTVARGFAALIRSRRTDLTFARIRELLSTNFFDWAIRDWEARLSWDMLRNLPPVEQARFQALDDGRLYLTLIEQLPDDLRDEAGMAGLVVMRGTDGSLADLSGEAARLLADQGPLIQAFREHVRDQSYELFVRLVRLGTPAPEGASAPEAASAPPSLSLLQAVVRRLDTLGLIRELFDALSPGVKQARIYWNDIALVLGARDPVHNRADLRRLLNVSTFLWVITTDSPSFEEALMAFHIIRSLPDDQRRMFELEDGGSYAARLSEYLSESMLHESGLSFAFTRPDEHGETPLRRQLADPAAWTGAAPADLALLLQMAVAAGDDAWIFEQSRLQRAWTVAALAPIVARFELYDPRVGRTIPGHHVVSAARTSSSLLGMLFGTGAYELEFFTRPVEGVDPFTGEPSVWAETSGVRATVDLEQMERNSGAPLSNAASFARTGGERISIGEDNREAALEQPNVIDLELNETTGIMRVRAARINLSRFAHVSTGSTFRTGAFSVSNLDLQLGFVPGNLREPRSGNLALSSIGIDELVYTAAGSSEPTGARRLEASTLSVNASFQTAPLPDSPVLGHVLGLLWDLVKNRDDLAAAAGASPSLTSATLSVGRIEMQGFRRGDLRLASATIEGVSIAAGGNRVAHLRAQEFVLAARIERARRDNPEGVADLLAEQGRVRTERIRLEPLEIELLALMSVIQHGEHLSPAASARLDELQRATGIGGSGGLQVDIASMSISGLDGPVRLGSASLTNIHGGGETASLAFQQLTSAEAIRRFISTGTPARARFGAGMADAGMSFTADDFQLADLSLPATIPALADIRTRLAAEGLTLSEQNQLRALEPLVSEYEALRAATLGITGPEPLRRTPAQQARLIELARQIGDMLDIRVAQVSVTQPIFGLRESEGTAVASAIARRIDARGIRAAGYTIDSIEALHPTGAIILDAASLGDVTAQSASEGFNARIGATSLAISGIHGPGITAREGQSITLSGIHANMRMAQDGLHIEDLAVAQFDLNAIDYNNGTHHIWSTGTSTATSITAHIRINRQPGGARGFGGLNYRSVFIEEFRIGRLDGAGLGYERLEGGTRKYSVEIDSGALLGFTLSGFLIDMSGDQTVTEGNVNVEGFDQTRFHAAFRQMLEVNGQLDRAVTGTPGVHVNMGTNGVTTIDLDALLATDTDVTYHGEGGSGGGMRITRGDLSGGIVMAGDDVRLNNLRMDSLEMSRIRWRTASGTVIRADGATVASNVRFSGRYTTLDPARSEFAIDSLRIDRIEASHITVDSGSMHLELPEPRGDGSYPLGEAASLSNIEITGLLIGMGPEGTRLGPTPEARGGRAHGSIGPSSAAFMARYADQLRVGGMINAERIDFWFGADGAIEGRGTGISGAGTAHYGSTDAPGTHARDVGVETGFGFRNLDTGLIRYADNVVSIGADGSAPLHLDRLELSQLELAGPSIEIFAPDTSTITATDIGARLSVHLHPTPAAAAAAHTPFERISIDQFSIANVAADGMRIHLLGPDLWLDMPMDVPFEVGPITMERPLDRTTGAAFEIVPSATGTALTGRVIAQNLRTERLQAHLVGALNARMAFNAESLAIGFAGSAGMHVDLMNWSATQITGYVMGNPDSRINLRQGSRFGTRHDVDGAGLFADRLTYDEADGGTVSIAGLNARGMRYDDEESGVHLDIRRIDAPDIAVDLGGNANGRRVISIPSATISDAYFRLDKLSSSGSGSGAATSPYFAGANAAAWLAANHDLFQSLQGNFELRGRFGVDAAMNIPGLDYDLNLNLPITDGAISYRDLESQLGAADALIDFKLYGSTLKIGLGFTLRTGDGWTGHVEESPVYKWFAEWNLDEPHLREVESGMIDFDQLLRARDPSFGTPSTGGNSPITGLIADHLALNLALNNSSPYVLSVSPYGSATLAPGALGGLSVHGTLQRLRPIDEAYPSRRRESIRSDTRPGLLHADLEHFDLQALDLTFPTRGRGSRRVQTGAVHIGAVSDAQIAFRGLKPQTAEGTLSDASVTDLVVTIAPDLVCPIPETVAPRPPGAPALDTPNTFREIENNGRPTTP